jgi:hypothetical protein
MGYTTAAYPRRSFQGNRVEENNKTSTTSNVDLFEFSDIRATVRLGKPMAPECTCRLEFSSKTVRGSSGYEPCIDLMWDMQ